MLLMAGTRLHGAWLNADVHHVLESGQGSHPIVLGAEAQLAGLLVSNCQSDLSVISSAGVEAGLDPCILDAPATSKPSFRPAG